MRAPAGVPPRNEQATWLAAVLMLCESEHRLAGLLSAVREFQPACPRRGRTKEWASLFGLLRLFVYLGKD